MIPTTPITGRLENRSRSGKFERINGELPESNMFTVKNRTGFQLGYVEFMRFLPKKVKTQINLRGV